MDDKKVLVTGASRGIGRAIAFAVSEAGYRVIAHYNRGREEAESLENEITQKKGSPKKGPSYNGSPLRGGIELIQFDISNREDCQEKLEKWQEENGAFWGIICNAGISADDSFPGMSGENWDKVLRTNLDGFYNVLHPLILPLCRKKKGRIITISSVSGLIGNRGQVNYSAAKAGIIGATKALAVELASRSITVNCIAPGIIETDMIRDTPLDMVLPSIPMGRIGKPEEVAALVVFLLSEQASYISRQVISVNGGLI